jgi:hypothetical protein
MAGGICFDAVLSTNCNLFVSIIDEAGLLPLDCFEDK